MAVVPVSCPPKDDGVGVTGARANQDSVRLFSFVEDLAEPIKNVAVTAWQSRGKLVRDVKSQVYLFSSAVASMPGRAYAVITNPKIHALLAEEEDPEALAAVTAGIGAGLCLGSAGAVAGASVGCPLGTMVGAVPALFTFGLSLPVGAVVGCSGGLCAGACVGSSAGFMGGASAGYVVAVYRVEIRNKIVFVMTALDRAHDVLYVQPSTKVGNASRRVRKSIKDSASYANEKARNAGRSIKGAAVDPATQCTVAGLTVGATTVGTAGAACGAALGCTTGALLGTVPAIFTFGLSIPIGAALGGTAGFCTGAAAGGAAGATGGSLVGYGCYRVRNVPSKLLSRAKEQVCAVADYATIARHRASSGGTEDED